MTHTKLTLFIRKTTIPQSYLSIAIWIHYGPHTMRLSKLFLCTLVLSACESEEVPIDDRQQSLAAVPGECYLVGDQNDGLSILDRSDTNPVTNETDVGNSGVADIEGIAVSPLTKILFAADADRLGTLNPNTGEFTPLPRPFGTASGSDGEQLLEDADGLTFDPCNGDFYASSRRDGEDDLLFKINSETGEHIPNAFGPGNDYVVVPAVLGLNDVDDIAIDPTSCLLYAIMNDGGTNDRLAIVNKTTGASTDVGIFGISDVEGMSFAPDGSLYVTTGSNSDVSGFYTINKATGAADVAGVVPLDNTDDYEGVDCMIAPDVDNDGLCELGENIVGSDPNDADTDDDGILDGAEPNPIGDVDGDGLNTVLDPDSDNDGLSDGTEVGITTPDADTDVSQGNFTPDADPNTTTDPLDPDTDDGGVTDGAEDVNHNGQVDAGELDPIVTGDDVPPADDDNDGLTNEEEEEIGSDPNDADTDDDGVLDGDEANAGFDTDGDGLINVLDPDSDNDGILDGTESGITVPHPDTDVSQGNFVPDADPSTTTFPLVADTDHGGVPDGAEDPNHDGAIDAGELDPNDPADDVAPPDDDNDGLTNAEEEAIGSDPNDADTDDDGVIDGDEPNAGLDSDGDGLINVLDPDSDNDGILDGTESGITTPHPDTDVDKGDFVPDADPSTTTSPLDPDTDDGGVPDGAEDPNHNGRIDTGEGDPNDPVDDTTAPPDDDNDGLTNAEEEELGSDPNDADTDDDGIIDGDEANPSSDTDGDGLNSVLDPDSDNDGIFDGTEVGITEPNADTDVDKGVFVPDADPSTTTFPLVPDSDHGGVPDGAEDPNHDGKIDPGELDPNDPSDDVAPPDDDNDGLTNAEEEELGSDPNDADSDDDGVIDGDEANPSADTDGDGLINVLDPDSDNDGLFDGTEVGITEPNADTDVNQGNFVPDADPDSHTSPVDPDTDDGGVPDGAEDTNHNGRVDPGEGDPNDESDDNPDGDDDNDGIPNGEDNCPSIANPDQADADNNGIGDVCENIGNGVFGISGGGCNSTGHSSTGWLGALAMMLFLGFWSRKRRFATGSQAPAQKRSLKKRHIAPLAVVAFFFSNTGEVNAQQITGDTNYSVERFQLSSDRLGILDVESAAVAEHMVLDLGLWAGYANDPLVVFEEKPNGDRSRVGSLVHNRFGGALLATLSLKDRYAVSVNLPLVLYQSDDLSAGVMSAGSLAAASIGDLALIPRVQILRQKKHGVDFGFRVALTLPTASDDNYVGNEGVTGEPALLLGRRFGKLRTLANVGYQIRKRLDSAGLRIDDEVFVKLGATHPLGPVNVEAAFRTATAADDLFDSFNRNHNELLGGANLPFGDNMIAFAAVGVGLTQGLGTPDWRSLIGLRLGRDLNKKKAAPRKLIVRGPIDSDGDGLMDPDDECPQEPEDFDGFEDDNGCPDPDNDQDMVLDVDDDCINEPGLVDFKGCMPADRDGDTVIDIEDNCPDVPGEVEMQGCKTEQTVKVTGTSLQVLDIVYFKTNKAIILARSYPLLNNVAAVLKSHPNLKDVVVEGHTDSRGDDDFNMDLSQRRAQAVVDYLVAQGVQVSRLRAKGYGETRPIASNDTNAGRSENRRVEFHIEGSDIEQRRSKPKGTLD